MELICGLSIITVILILQLISISSLSGEFGDKIVLSESQSASFNNAALPTFAILVIGGVISLIGVHKMFQSWRGFIDEKASMHSDRGMTVPQRVKTLIASSLQKEKRVFWFSLVGYSIIFLLLSGTVIYSAENISEKYGVTIPSSYITGCCGQPGDFPVLTIYLLEHLGLLITPSNVLLLLFLPLLVAINISIFIYNARLTNTSRKINASSIGKDASICGISVGLFAGCPTCAGSVLFSLISNGSLSSLGLAGVTFAGYQPFFMVASIIILLSAPLISVLKT